MVPGTSQVISMDTSFGFYLLKLYAESFFDLSAGLRREERDRRHPTEDAKAQAQPSPTELTTFSALSPSK
jgi:hypothetical protein